MVSFTLEGLWILSDRIVDFSSNFTVSDLHYFSVFELLWSMLVVHQIAPNQAKDFIKMMSVTRERLWMVSDTVVDSRFLVKFHKSEPAIIFSS